MNANQSTDILAQFKSIGETEAKTELVPFSESGYLQIDGAIHWCKQGVKGLQDIKLCNFQAQITEEITKEDGIQKTRFYCVEGFHEQGFKLPKAEVEASKFDKMDWLNDAWGSTAIIEVGTKYKEHVAAAIKKLSKPKSVTVFQNIGWQLRDRKWFYLHAGGAIKESCNDSQIIPDLPNALESYNLSTPSKCSPTDVQEAFDVFTSILPNHQGLLLMSAAFRSVLSEFDTCLFSIFLQGTTGTFKSCLAAGVQSFFGSDFNYSNLPANWSGTANALEKLSYVAKDAVLTVDDFVPTGNHRQISAAHTTAERLLRGQGNHAGRERLANTTQFRGAYRPRGVIFSTGEDLPNGNSLQARMVILSIDKGSVDTEQLRFLQELGEEGALSQLLSDFIGWIAGIVNSQPLSEFKQRLQTHRSEITKRIGSSMKQHARQKENFVSLLLGIWLFLEFSGEQEIFRADQTEEIRQKTIEAATAVGKVQERVNEESSLPEQFIASVSSALSMGIAHLECRKQGGCPLWCATNVGWKQTLYKTDGNQESWRSDPQGRRIGWIDKEGVYLEPQSALIIAKEQSQKIGCCMGASVNALKKALNEGGYLTRTNPSRQTYKVRLADKSSKNTLCMELKHFVELELDISPAVEEHSTFPF